MISEDYIKKHLEPFLGERHLFIVDISISFQNNIEIIIDGDNYVSINDCTDVSRFVESFLNRDIEDYSLIVSSPDANKPLKISRQYPKHIGKKIQILTNENKEYKGTLTAADEKEITILTEIKNKENKKNKIIKEEIKISFQSIKKAKILLPF